MNFQMLGMAVPHLHCHIVPRYYGDAAPNRPLDPNLGARRLAADEASERVAALRAALAAMVEPAPADAANGQCSP